MGKQLTDNFLPLENAVLEQNALVINTGDQLVLFDTGMGRLKLFGPTTGKLLSSMKQAGVDPKDIDAVVMTHAHIDHCGGCVSEDGSRHFPNAQYYIVESGDTLGAIAAKYDTTVNELLTLNPDVDPSALQPGQRIRVG